MAGGLVLPDPDASVSDSRRSGHRPGGPRPRRVRHAPLRRMGRPERARESRLVGTRPGGGRTRRLRADVPAGLRTLGRPVPQPRVRAPRHPPAGLGRPPGGGARRGPRPRDRGARLGKRAPRLVRGRSAARPPPCLAQPPGLVRDAGRRLDARADPRRARPGGPRGGGMVPGSRAGPGPDRAPAVRASSSPAGTPSTASTWTTSATRAGGIPKAGPPT